MRTRTTAVAAAALALAALVPTGCGGSDEAAAPDLDTCREVTGDAFTITAGNMAFTDRCLVVDPGTYDITFVNEDEGTGHDLHLSREGVVDTRTDLTVGPDTHRLDVDLTEPGSYRFTCDPHANMVGTIEVRDPAAAPAPSDDGPATSTTVTP